MNVIFAGGATGGHLFPGFAVADAFLADNPLNKILFVGSDRVLEKKLIKTKGYGHISIETEGIKGRGIINQIRALLKIPEGIAASMKIMHDFKPDLVFGLGGYSAGPVGISAWLMGIFLVIQEQNRIPGITNRLLAIIAKRYYVSFPDTKGLDNAGKRRFSGNPVRMEIIQGVDLKKFAFKHDKTFTIMVIGGSQGAHGINMSMIRALGHLGNDFDYEIIHQTGDADYRLCREAYDKTDFKSIVAPFFQDMKTLYAGADLIICRSGASTIAEITALGLASILVPFPYAADNHQEMNARFLADAGGAEIILQDKLDGPVLADRIRYYAENSKKLTRMRTISKRLGKPEAAQFIVEDCKDLLSIC